MDVDRLPAFADFFAAVLHIGDSSYRIGMIRASSLSLLLLGCGPEAVTIETETKGDTTDPLPPVTSTDPTSAGPTGGPNCGSNSEMTDSCCFSVEDSGRPTDTCPSDTLCPDLIIHCNRSDPDCAVWTGFNGTPQPISVNDAGALNCALEALSKGSPGLLTWTFDWGLPTVDRYYIQETRAAFTYRADSDEAGLLYIFSDLTKQMLMPSKKFELCAANPNLREQVRCLQAVTTGEPIETCNEEARRQPRPVRPAPPP